MPAASLPAPRHRAPLRGQWWIALLAVTCAWPAAGQPAPAGQAADIVVGPKRGTAPAQPRPERPAGRADVEDATQAAADALPFEGRVAAYVLSPDAGVAGLLLDNGRQVRVPPHLGARLASLVQPGQWVRIGPEDTTAKDLGPARMRSITAVDAGRTLVDTAPAPLAGEPLSPAPIGDVGDGATLHALKVSGTIRQTLKGARGEANGVLLTSGVQVAFPPHVGLEAGAWLVAGQTIEVEGFGRTSSYGTVVQATRIAAPGVAELKVYGPAPVRP